MNEVDNSASTDPYILREIIRMQTEIAKLGLDLGGVVSQVVDRVQSLTNAGGAIVEFSEGAEMVYRGAGGVAKPLLGLRKARGGSLSGLCVEQGHILQSDDIETDARVDWEAYHNVGLRSMLVAPLDHNGITVGVLKIVSTSANAFNARDVRVLELMSELIAAAMYHCARNETNPLYVQATHDALTGLANRALFYDRLRQRLHLARRQSDSVAILNIDMDGLKPVNDQFGHRTGDAAIRETASRISRISRQSDTVARLGGDEFGVILGDVKDRSGARAVADRVAEEIRLPFEFENHHLCLNASIGIGVCPEDGTEIEALIDSADQSMYAIKRTRTCR
ncbi:MAG: sensor domain-containing diguanylate cyclase [Terracidiphilus sp.]